MRPVNLLPQKDRPRESNGRPGSAYAVLGVLGVLLVAVVVYVLTANQVTSKQEELARAERDTAAAEARAAELAAFGSFAQIKEARLGSVRALAQARLDWERLMRELAHVLPDNAFVTSLNASAAQPAGQEGAGQQAGPAAPTLELVGCAPSQPDVATLMVRLRGLHRANDVRLVDSTRKTDGGGSGGEDCGPTYKFTVKVSFDPIDQIAPEGEKVPAHLGGGA